MSVVSALYLVLLAAVAGYVLIGRVPSTLHTPMLSGSNFIHGIVLAGAMLALSSASGSLELIIGFIAVTAAAANVVGGFIVTDRMLNLFDAKGVHGAGPVLEFTSGEEPQSMSDSKTDNPGAKNNSQEQTSQPMHNKGAGGR